MNLFRKIFARTYQFCFHLALPVLPYREPVCLNSVLEIACEMKKKGIQKPLLVTDSYLRNSGATKELEDSLLKAGISYAVYDQTRANPTADNVENAKKVYLQEHCDSLIAFGGGSAMDCAKAVGALVRYPKRNLEKIRGNLKIWRKLPPFFAVPTTAGTGSEVTVTAVITDEEKKYKYTMNAFPLISHYVVMDAKVTYTLPKHLTATTGMDALTHAVEAYIGRSTSKETRRLCKEAVKLVLENVQTAYYEPTNYEARTNMLQAAYKAGIAFSKSYVGYIHAVAHSLGGQYNVPHGLANAVLLPIFLEEYGSAIHKKLYQLACYAEIANKEDSYEAGAKKLIDKIKDLNKNMQIPTTISGILSKDIPTMAKHADQEGNPLYPVPILWNAKELERFYHMVSEESVVCT
ncbi:MAG: iron-containing alcohol dehydrogenase [Clostridia bacterium]|nr:iron-containing alcohol dehydrogenase [Clostridia bacterium]